MTILQNSIYGQGHVLVLVCVHFDVRQHHVRRDAAQTCSFKTLKPSFSLQQDFKISRRSTIPRFRILTGAMVLGLDLCGGCRAHPRAHKSSAAHAISYHINKATIITTEKELILHLKNGAKSALGEGDLVGCWKRKERVGSSRAHPRVHKSSAAHVIAHHRVGSGRSGPYLKASELGPLHMPRLHIHVMSFGCMIISKVF